MAKNFRPFDRAAGRESSEPGFLEGGRESFTQAFAYDHFQWPALKVFGSARPSVMEFRAPAERAAEARGLDSGDDHAAQLYTPTNSDIPLYLKIGRATCRDRVCQYGSISVGAVSIKQKKS